MSFRSTVFRIAFSFVLVFCFGIPVLADTIHLKDGSRVKGKIVRFSGGRFVVAVGEGSRRREMTLLAADVDSIDFDTPRTATDNVLASDRRTQPARVESKQPVVQKPAVTPVIDEDEKVEQVASSIPASPPRSTSIPSTSAPAKKVSYGKPIALSVKVLADNTSNGWTNSGWVVKKGQRIRISGSGQVSIGRGKTTGPSGLYDLPDNDKLLKSVPTGALIAVIGDDNNEFIYIGAEREFTAARDGALFLGVNEGNLSDNTGSFDVKVEISPDSSE